MKIIIASATAFETGIAKEEIFQHKNFHEIIFKITGIGLLSSAVTLTQIALQEKPDLVIQAGIAGCFQENLLGKPVVVKQEAIGDMGVYEDGQWKNIFDLKLEDANILPYKNEVLINENIKKWNLLSLQEVTGISVNEISTDKKKINELKEKNGAEIESMEGAALHYICKKFYVNFIQIRSVSNIVAERDKTKWMMHSAIENLNQTLIKYINELNIYEDKFFK